MSQIRTLPGSVTISFGRDADDKQTVRIAVHDVASRHTFVIATLTAEAFTAALSSRAYTPATIQVEGLERVGLRKFRVSASTALPATVHGREAAEAWLKARVAPLGGWIVDPYLGSRDSITRDGFGRTTAHFALVCYVPEGEPIPDHGVEGAGSVVPAELP